MFMQIHMTFADLYSHREGTHRGVTQVNALMFSRSDIMISLVRHSTGLDKLSIITYTNCYTISYSLKIKSPEGN